MKCWLQVNTGLGDPGHYPYGEDRAGTKKRITKAFKIADSIAPGKLRIVIDEDALLVAELTEQQALKALRLMVAEGKEFNDIDRETDPEEALRNLAQGDFYPSASLGCVGHYDIWVSLSHDDPGDGGEIENLTEFKKAATKAGFLG